MYVAVLISNALLAADEIVLKSPIIGGFVRSFIQVVLNRSPAFLIVIKWRIFVLLGKNKLLKNFFCCMR